MKLDLSQIESPVARDNFRKLDDEFRVLPLLNGQFKLFDLEFPSAQSSVLTHNLGFIPQDVIITFNTAGFVYLLKNLTSEKMEYTTSSAGRVRFLLGRMK